MGMNGHGDTRAQAVPRGRSFSFGKGGEKMFPEWRRDLRMIPDIKVTQLVSPGCDFCCPEPDGNEIIVDAMIGRKISDFCAHHVMLLDCGYCPWCGEEM